MSLMSIELTVSPLKELCAYKIPERVEYHSELRVRDINLTRNELLDSGGGGVGMGHKW